MKDSPRIIEAQPGDIDNEPVTAGVASTGGDRYKAAEHDIEGRIEGPVRTAEVAAGNGGGIPKADLCVGFCSEKRERQENERATCVCAMETRHGWFPLGLRWGRSGLQLR